MSTSVPGEAEDDFSPDECQVPVAFARPHARWYGARGRVGTEQTMLVSYEGATIDPHLELVAVADDLWRISDGRIPENDARRVLGLAERREGCVEVMWMRSVGPAGAGVQCIAEALAAASERMQRLDAVRWRRRSPPSSCGSDASLAGAMS